MRIFVPKERRPDEARVAATPETVKRLIKAGLEVHIETGAGVAAHFKDAEYEEAGAKVVAGSAADWSAAGVVIKVAPPGHNEKLEGDEVEAVAGGSILIGLLEPHRNLEMVTRLRDRGVTTLAMELIPRTTRAQSMDALSSQASIGGYKAALLAADRLGKYFPLLMTAAGTIPPARVVILGAGVAGLQALATAKRLGAVVEVSDIRPAVKEEVQSLGGKFIDFEAGESGEGAGGYARQLSREALARQQEILKRHIAAADVVITTAQVPGKKAPVLVTADMVEAMHEGSVLVDLAAERGGNCELTRCGEEVTHNGVLILGPPNLPATMAKDASILYARNILALLQDMLAEGEIRIDMDNEITAGTLLTHGGKVVPDSITRLLERDTPQEVAS